MPSTVFTDLSRNNLKKGFLLTHGNSFEHYWLAKICEQNGKFGLGVSHLVLSGEESLKATAIISQVLGLSFFDANDIDLLFNQRSKSKHSEKHKMATEKYAVVREKLVSLLEEKLSKKELPVGTLNGISIFLEEYKDVGMLSWDEEKFNLLKNQGFYVDLNKTGWGAPRDLCKAEYDKILYSVSAYRVFNDVVGKIFGLIPA